MYFLVRGVISVEKMILDNETQEWSNQKISDLQAGSYFGELALLLKPKPGLKGQRRAASCIAVTDCDARLLNKTIFNQVCDDFPELRLYLQAEADRKYAMYSSKTAEELKADREKANRITSMKATLSTSKVATLGSLQSTLDSINTRMTRLEVNMGRLQAKGGVGGGVSGGVGGGSGSGSGGGARGSQLNNVQPPTTVATGSNGRRYITSPSITTAAKVGWKSVRKVVVPETTTPTTPTTTRTPSLSISSITTKSMLSNSRWGSPTHASAGAVVSSPTHTKESLSAMERAIEEAHKHATAAQERQKASPPFQNDQPSPSKMLSNRRWG